MQLLNVRGVNVEHGGTFRCDPLGTATMRGHIDAVRVLVEAGANVNAGDVFGRSALWVAVEKGPADVVADLVEVDGIAMNLRNEEGETAFGVAIERGHDIVVELLRAHGGVE